MISADAPSCIRQIDEAMQNGQEVSVFLRDISTHLRSVLMASVCGAEQAAQVLGVTQEDARQYVEQASSTSRDRLMAILRRFLESIHKRKDICELSQGQQLRDSRNDQESHERAYPCVEAS